MLSIVLDEGREWWVQSRIFSRLVDAAVADGAPAEEMNYWREVTCGHGGIDIHLLEPDKAEWLRNVLLTTARREVARLGNPDPMTVEGGYVLGLRRLLGLYSEAESGQS
jgi:hypothetical protein